jgi:hypothetical protein
MTVTATTFRQAYKIWVLQQRHNIREKNLHPETRDKLVNEHISNMGFAKFFALLEDIAAGEDQLRLSDAKPKTEEGD